MRPPQSSGQGKIFSKKKIPDKEKKSVEVKADTAAKVKDTERNADKNEKNENNEDKRTEMNRICSRNVQKENETYRRLNDGQLNATYSSDNSPCAGFGRGRSVKSTISDIVAPSGPRGRIRTATEALNLFKSSNRFESLEND